MFYGLQNNNFHSIVTVILGDSAVSNSSGICAGVCRAFFLLSLLASNLRFMVAMFGSPPLGFGLLYKTVTLSLVTWRDVMFGRIGLSSET